MADYDSTHDTMMHIANIQDTMLNIIIPELTRRAKNHDQSKLSEPEKSCYDKFIPLLKTEKYGSPGYRKIRDQMHEEGMDHHFEVNRHHPEHFEHMVNDMNIVDFVEMVCDWFAASLRSDTTFMEGLDGNAKKYDLPETMVNILKNTYKDYFEDFDKQRHGKDPIKENRAKTDKEVIRDVLDEM
jgi:hypothetical protein